MASGVSTLSEGCKTCSTLISDPLLPNSAPRNTVKPKLFCFHIGIHPCLIFLPTYEPHHSRWVAGTMREGLTKNPSRKCHRIHLWWTQTTLFWLGKKHVFCKAIFRDWETLTFHTGWNTFDIVATVTEERLCGRNNTISRVRYCLDAPEIDVVAMTWAWLMGWNGSEFEESS